jgi:RNA polymerase sigma-70 factor, ECF subfamily
VSSDGAFSLAWEAARRAWPDLKLDATAFAQFLASRQAGAQLHASDLYLAAACLAGEREALEAFDREVLGPLTAQLSARTRDRAAAEETVQQLRVRLLVRDAKAAAKLDDYDGRGPLAGWVRVVAARTASNTRRDEATRAQHSALASSPGSSIDPDLALLQRKYGAQFETALREAFGQLDAEERTALKLSYAEGLNLEGVARALGLSRATAGRRVLSGREKLREATLALLQVRLQATPTELASLLQVVRSKLELSLRGLASSWR